MATYEPKADSLFGRGVKSADFSQDAPNPSCIPSTFAPPLRPLRRPKIPSF